MLTRSNITITVQGHQCLRCGHKWIPQKKDVKPRVCPNSKCHTAYWDIPPKKKGVIK